MLVVEFASGFGSVGFFKNIDARSGFMFIFVHLPYSGYSVMK